jgi:hypothetical protein
MPDPANSTPANQLASATPRFEFREHEIHRIGDAGSRDTFLEILCYHEIAGKRLLCEDGNTGRQRSVNYGRLHLWRNGDPHSLQRNRSEHLCCI